MTQGNKPKYMEAFLIHGEDVTPKWDYSHHVVPPMTASVIYRLGSTERGAQGFAQFGDYEKMEHDPIYIYERIDEPTTGMLVVMGVPESQIAIIGAIPWIYPLAILIYVIIQFARPNEPKYPTGGFGR